MIKKNYKKIKFSTGFTLIELLVTLSIFAVTTGIVMTSQGKFDNTVLLTNTAYDIAISIRQAQTYGVNSKEGTTKKFNPYGIVFNTALDNKRFNLFEDLSVPLDFKYSNNEVPPQNVDFSCQDIETECADTYKLKRGNFIKSICAGDNDADCDAHLISGESLNISFKRPDPEAIILVGDLPYSNSSNRRSYAKIVISSAEGATRSIVVTKVGQIYVKR